VLHYAGINYDNELYDSKTVQLLIYQDQKTINEY